MIKIDLAGKRFGKLVVIEKVGIKRTSKTSTRILWRCVCDCGEERITTTSRITSGVSRHCGKPKCRKGSHGHCVNREASPTYNSWKCMISRCKHPSNPSFKHYKNRGITVCGRWEQFKNFLADMGERPKELSLDRIDNNGNYEPGNCRWATKREQANNRVTNIIFSYRENKYTLAELSRKTGVNKETLRYRLVRPGGWSVEDAVKPPL